MNTILVLSIVGAMVVLVFGFGVLFAKCYHRAKPGQALILSTPSGRRISTEGIMVLPFVHRVDTLDLTAKSFTFEYGKRENLATSDGIRVVVKLALNVRVNDATEDVLKVAERVGCARTSDPEALREFFAPYLKSAIGVVFSNVRWDDIGPKRSEIEDLLLAATDDLDGYVIEKLSLDDFRRA